jgi:hypothetical protein
MDGGRSSYSGHDDGSTVGVRTTIEHQPPPQAMTHFLGGAMSMSTRSVNQRCAQDNATTKQAHGQASHYHSSVA